MKKIYLFLLAILMCQSISATHIIGGTMTYEHLGGDQYEIQLEVLRDCWNGNPNAYFDDPASVGVFDENNTLIENLLIPFQGIDDTISLAVPNSVCNFPVDVCIHKTMYIDTVSLPAITGGYDLQYQRCCRAVTIVNLVDPLATGMTFHTHIDPVIPNSSPQHKKDIPFAVFSNTPFIYDASATDADGDSLVYELVSPFTGASQAEPQPSPPDFLFTFVPFVDPPYSVDNMLGGTYPLTIDPVTGEMSAIPPTLGVFQIAYAIKEYRNNELIGTTYREFTFVVIVPSPTQNYDISGSVLIGGGIPLDQGTVQILERDIATDSLSVYEEQNVGIDGTYSFSGIPPGVFYVKATVDPASIYYDTYLPTYYNSSSFWYDADPISQCDTSQLYRDIHLIHVDSLLGNFVLDGLVSLPGTGTPVSNLTLLLQNDNEEFIQTRVTNSIGYFMFENLEAGTYRIFADLVNSNILNANPPEITMSGDTSVQVFLYDDMLTVEVSTSVKPQIKESDFEINLFPNPTDDDLNVSLSLKKSGIYTLKIVNLYGQCLSTVFENKLLLKGKNTSKVSLNKLPAGTYFIEIQNENETMIRKVVRN